MNSYKTGNPHIIASYALPQKINKKNYVEYEIYERQVKELTDEINELTDRLNSRQILENQHQSDCIKINRLNVALDIMTEKYVNLRKSVGLE